ncbi:MAG: enoyl-CoA hydratase-related protein [Chlorobi bacterium]|nr:enoyl-CoA hydratase-related protein [Chlorobiota bacterium]
MSTLQLETRGSTLVVTLYRPDKLNAINSIMLEELRRIFSDEQFFQSHRSIVVTGSGKAFAAGADIAELAACSRDTGQDFAQRGQYVFQLIESSPIPVIAAVNGYALGGGCELAMACHLRFAAETAVFGQPEVKLGIIPGYGGTQRLTRLIGVARAVEFMLTGEYLAADRAHTLGLVNRVYPHEKLLEETLRFCAQLEALPKTALTSILHCTYGVQLSAMDVEAREFGILCGTEDFREGTAAFLEKRTPAFKGR